MICLMPLNFEAHPWLRGENQDVPLDILIYKLVKTYVRATPLKRAALKVFSLILSLTHTRVMLFPKNFCFCKKHLVQKDHSNVSNV